MIKRRYFMFVRKLDGSDPSKYSSHERIITITSWFPDPLRAYNEGKREAALALMYEPEGPLLIEAFNRI